MSASRDGRFEIADDCDAAKPSCASSRRAPRPLRASGCRASTRRIGRTAAWARTKCGASAPAPTITKRRGVRAGEIVGSKRRCGGGAAARQFGAVDHGDSCAGVVVDQQIACRDGRQALGGIVGLDDHGLEAGEGLRPGRHQKQDRDWRECHGGGGPAWRSRRESLARRPRRYRDRARASATRSAEMIFMEVRPLRRGTSWRPCGFAAQARESHPGRAAVRCGLRARRGATFPGEPAGDPAGDEADEDAAEEQRPERHVDRGAGVHRARTDRRTHRSIAGWRPQRR